MNKQKLVIILSGNILVYFISNIFLKGSYLGFILVYLLFLTFFLDTFSFKKQVLITLIVHLIYHKILSIK